MGRGIARKAAYGKKCNCDNPHVYRNFIEVNNKNEISYILSCSNCNAYWKTKSPDARKHWESIMDEPPKTWENGYSYNGNLTTRQLFSNLDNNRLDYLEKELKFSENKLKEMQEEVNKKRKAIEKFKKQIKGR